MKKDIIPSSSIINTLAPVKSDLELFIKNLNHNQLTKPFAQSRLNTISKLSKRISNQTDLKKDPQSLALAYWLREANLKNIYDKFLKTHLNIQGQKTFPVGLVFHLAPANVDTIFVYSWALAYLTGNSNILRLSQNESPILKLLLKCINDEMEKDKELRSSNFFITYPHDELITTAISELCSLRIIWGGNDTVRNIRKLPLNPHAGERVFPTKYSYTLINSETYANSPSNHKAQIASLFYRDLFPFDQMGCSSPHRVLWIGKTSLKLDFIFDKFLDEELKKRSYSSSLSSSVRRRNYAFDLAADGKVSFDPSHVGFTSINSLKGFHGLRPKCGSGLYAHSHLQSSEILKDIVEESDQTVTHFGFNQSELDSISEILGLGGVDRLVPIGEALGFEATWDGYDLIGDFIKRIVIRS